MSIARVQKLVITPLNQQDAYSFSKGNPIINFQIGRQMSLLDARSVNLHFKLSVKAPDGNTPTNIDTLADGDHACFINERLGAWSFIDRVTISEASRNQTIEGCRDIGRVLAAVRPASISAEAMNAQQNMTMSCGNRISITANMLNRDLDVCCNLSEISGFLNTGPVRLDMIPLNISVQLAPDAQALQVYPKDTTTAANKRTKDLMGYSISDVKLTCDLFVPDAELAKSLSGKKTFETDFDSYSTVYNVQNSSNQTTSVQFGLGAVKSVFTTLLPPDRQNNFEANSFLTDEFPAAGGGDAVVDRVGFLRASQLYPIENELEVKEQNENFSPAVPVIKHGLRSVGRHNARQVTSTLSSPILEIGVESDLLFDGTPCVQVAPAGRAETSPFPLKIYGVDMDSYSNAGLDFRGVAYGLRANMNSAAPVGLHTTAVARHTVVVKDNTVSVMS